MTQESMVRWAGDSPNVNAAVKRATVPIGYTGKETTTVARRARGVQNDDDGSLDSPPPSAPISLFSFSREPITDGTAAPSFTPPRGASKCANALLQKLKTMITDKRPRESPYAEERIFDSSDPLDDTVSIGIGSGSLPSTSTPTTASAPAPRITQRDPLHSQRNRMLIKRQRLVLPDGPDGACKETGSKLTNDCDDDSLIASLDLDALVNEARRKRTLAGGGTPFKRSKTTGDLSDTRVAKAVGTEVATVTLKEMKINDNDDDDSFFADENVLAEVERLEHVCQTQRTQRLGK